MMKKNQGWCLALTFTISPLFSACSPIDSTRPFDQKQAATLVQSMYTTKPAKQKIALQIPDKHNWERINASYGTFNSPIVLVPNGQTLSQYNEKIATDINAYRHNPEVTPRNFVTLQITKAQQECKEVNIQHLDSGESSSVMFRIDMNHCLNGASQIQIGKAFAGMDAVYYVYYQANGTIITVNRLKQMSKVIADAELVRA